MDYVHDPLIAEQKNNSDTPVQIIDDGFMLFQVTHVEADNDNSLSLFGIKINQTHSTFYEVFIKIIVIAKIIFAVIVLYVAIRFSTCCKKFIDRNTKVKKII